MKMRSSALAPLLLACGAAAGCSKDVVLACLDSAPIAVTVSPQAVTIAPGETASFRALVNGGSSVPYSCGGVTHQPFRRAVTWSISNGTIAGIVASTDSTALVRGAGAGTATVIATSVGDATAKGAALVRVQ